MTKVVFDTSVFDKFILPMKELYFEKQFILCNQNERNNRNNVLLVIVNDTINLVDLPNNITELPEYPLTLTVSRPIKTLTNHCYEKPFYKLQFSRINSPCMKVEIEEYFLLCSDEKDAEIIKSFIELAGQLVRSRTSIQINDYLKQLKNNYGKSLVLNKTKDIPAFQNFMNPFDRKFLKKVISNPFKTENLVIRSDEFAQELTNSQDYIVPLAPDSCNLMNFPTNETFDLKILNSKMMPQGYPEVKEPLKELARVGKPKNINKPAPLDLKNVKIFDYLMQQGLPTEPFIALLQKQMREQGMECDFFYYISQSFKNCPVKLASPEPSISPASSNSPISNTSKNIPITPSLESVKAEQKEIQFETEILTPKHTSPESSVSSVSKTPSLEPIKNSEPETNTNETLINEISIVPAPILPASSSPRNNTNTFNYIPKTPSLEPIKNSEPEVVPVNLFNTKTIKKRSKITNTLNSIRQSPIRVVQFAALGLTIGLMCFFLIMITKYIFQQ